MPRYIVDDNTYEDELRDDLVLCYPGWPRHLIREAAIMTSNVLLAFDAYAEKLCEAGKAQHTKGMPIKLGLIPGKIRYASALLVLERLHYCELSALLKIFPDRVQTTVFIRKEESAVKLHTLAPSRCGAPYDMGTACILTKQPHLVTTTVLQRTIEERPPWRRAR